MRFLSILTTVGFEMCDYAS